MPQYAKAQYIIHKKKTADRVGTACSAVGLCYTVQHISGNPRWCTQQMLALRLGRFPSNFVVPLYIVLGLRRTQSRGDGRDDRSRHESYCSSQKEGGSHPATTAVGLLTATPSIFGLRMLSPHFLSKSSRVVVFHFFEGTFRVIYRSSSASHMRGAQGISHRPY